MNIPKGISWALRKFFSCREVIMATGGANQYISKKKCFYKKAVFADDRAL